MRNMLVASAILLLAMGFLVFVPKQEDVTSVPKNRRERAQTSPADKPARPLSLLFVHHSVGAQLLAEPGPDGTPGKSSRGGGFRRLLEADGYRVHTATYGSELGQHTDLFDWPGKFSSELDRLLTTADGTRALSGGARHDVILFKSCFPNNEFEGPGVPPGNPQGPELTLENAKASLRSLLPEFKKHPDVLFAYLTVPPLAPRTYREPLGKWLAKAALGRSSAARLARQAELAREFDEWTASDDGWLKGYPLKNVAVIDYYDILTGDGASNLLRYPSGDGSDSHPSSAGQKMAAPRVLAALNTAVDRAGIAARTATPVVESATSRVAGGIAP